MPDSGFHVEAELLKQLNMEILSRNPNDESDQPRSKRRRFETVADVGGRREQSYSNEDGSQYEEVRRQKEVPLLSKLSLHCTHRRRADPGKMERGMGSLSLPIRETRNRSHCVRDMAEWFLHLVRTVSFK